MPKSGFRLCEEPQPVERMDSCADFVDKGRIATPRNLRHMLRVNHLAWCIENLVVVVKVAEQHLKYDQIMSLRSNIKCIIH